MEYELERILVNELRQIQDFCKNQKCCPDCMCWINGQCELTTYNPDVWNIDQICKNIGTKPKH